MGKQGASASGYVGCCTAEYLHMAISEHATSIEANADGSTECSPNSVMARLQAGLLEGRPQFACTPASSSRCQGLLQVWQYICT